MAEECSKLKAKVRVRLKLECGFRGFTVLLAQFPLFKTAMKN